MKRILLVTDFSEPSHQAIEYAISLFKENKAIEYILYNINEDTHPESEMLISINDLLEENLKENLHKEFKIIQKKFPEIEPSRISYLAESGNFLNKINQLVQDNKINLIVLGKKYKRNFKGNTVKDSIIKFIKTVNCPLMLIP